MGRVHLFELMDQGWFPTIFRDYMTDHVRFYVTRGFRPAWPKIAEAIKLTGTSDIVDLCSGAGGAVMALIPYLEQELGTHVTVTLTDLYPNKEAIHGIKEEQPSRARYRPESTSAFDVPVELSGFRTIFTALHHFEPKDARRILRDAVEKHAPIGAFEVQERTLWRIVTVPLFILVGSFLLTPFVGKITIARLFFTYIVPLAPLGFAWNTFVSCLRTYSPTELKELTNDLQVGGYRWEIGQIEATGLIGRYRITYLFGFPSAAQSN